MHIVHRLHIFLLAVVKFFPQFHELVIEHTDITIEHIYIATDSVDRLTFVSNLCIDDHKVLKALFNVAFIVAQLFLLHSNLLLKLLTLIFQSTD